MDWQRGVCTWNFYACHKGIVGSGVGMSTVAEMLVELSVIAPHRRSRTQIYLLQGECYLRLHPIAAPERFSTAPVLGS
eukprot:6481748-Amphidinium_carterae.1